MWPHPIQQRHSPRHNAGRLLTVISLILSSAVVIEGHVGPWAKGMYCMNGTAADARKEANPNADEAVQPLSNLTQADWWFHHFNKCDEFPPNPGDFLELPANGKFTIELAVNRAFTTLSEEGKRSGVYLNGENDPPSDSKENISDCISHPNIHTQNETMAAGTVFAISYVSNLQEVTKENLVVFTVLPRTPWRRIATYDVPNLPACPKDGCICAWGWVPYGCGVANIYMLGFRCRVIGNTGDAAVASGVPPVYCEADQSKCAAGAKQMVYWNQKEGNNVETTGFDLAGQPKSPGYNLKMGFHPGGQRDIFLEKGSADPTYVSPIKSSALSIYESFTDSFVILLFLALLATISLS